GLRDAAGHVETDHHQAGLADFANRGFNFAAHQRSCQDQSLRARQTRHGTDGIRQLLLADQGDGVDRDVLAPDIVAIGFGDRSDGNLPYLRATTHDDNALAVNLLKRLDNLDALHDLQ